MIRFRRSKGYGACALAVLSAWVASSALAATVALPGERAFPESLTSTQDGTLYVGSTGQGGIVRIAPGATAPRVFVAPGAFQTRSILGVLADERSQTLWACSGDYSAAGIHIPGGAGGNAIKGFDLQTGKGKLSATLPDEKGSCNDFAIASDGTLFVSDEGNGQVLKLNASGQLEKWAADQQLDDIDGLAFGEDGNLYANSYGHNTLVRIGVRDGVAGKITTLQLSRPIDRPDGMRSIGGNRFLMVEGGGKLDRITITGDSAKIETLADGLLEPSAVAPAGKIAWVALGQISRLAGEGKKPVTPFQVVSIPIDGRDAHPTAGANTRCAGDKGGLVLSPGFCATVFAENLGHARHMAVAQNGTVYVNTWSSGFYTGGDKQPTGGSLVALRDTKGTGHADVVQRFGPGPAQKNGGGTGIALHGGYLYAEANDRIVRYALAGDAIAPAGAAQVVVSGLPMGDEHPMHPIAIDGQGNLFVNAGSATNTCQPQNAPEVAGNNPCPELQTRAGIWRFDADKTGQVFSPTARYAMGIRNTGGLAFDSAGRLFGTQHGRDLLSQNWPKLYKASQGPELPAEEMLELREGADYGWPTCYFDGLQKKLVLSPEYGGDGGRTVGVCAQKMGPIAFFPAHWAPNALVIYKATQFPSGYRGGAFIAFHGSWNRAPAPQEGYNVVFQPMSDGHPAGEWVVFADGFAGDHKEPGRAIARPSGLAVDSSGALLISDDIGGRIWRVTYEGPSDGVPVAAAPKIAIKNPAADIDVSHLTPPEGVSRQQLTLGARIFHGQVAGGTCTGCHASDAKGSELGPDLTRGKWLWSDGSLQGIVSTIHKGVPQPKASAGAMPPDGGVELTDNRRTAVAAYVWALGHSK